MYRYIKKVVFWSIGLLAMFLIIRLFFPALGKINSDKGFTSKNNTYNDSTHIQNGYAPIKGHWIEFNIPQGACSLKIVSNAIYYMSDNLSYKYVVDLEILNVKNTVIYSNSYAQIGKVRLFKERGSNRILSNPFLIDANRYLTKNYEIILPLEKLESPSILRLRWNSEDSGIKQVLFRVARESKSSKANEENQWLRMPVEKQNEIASNSVFLRSDLTANEIKNFLSRKWHYLSVINKPDSSFNSYRVGYLPSAKLKALHQIASVNQKKSNSSQPIKSELFKLYIDSAGGIFKSPSRKNIKNAEVLFRKLFELKDIDKELTDNFSKLGFDVREIKTKNNVYLAVYDKKNIKMVKVSMYFAGMQRIKIRYWKCLIDFLILLQVLSA